MLCDIKGYDRWQSVAECLGRSVIVEGEAHEDLGGDGVNPDSVRGCAFNRAELDDQEMTGIARSWKAEGVGWVVFLCGIAVLLNTGALGSP